MEKYKNLNKNLENDSYEEEYDKLVVSILGYEELEGINLSNSDEKTISSYIDLLTKYINNGCDVNNHYNTTLLDWAIMVDRLDFAKFLIEKGSEFDCPNSPNVLFTAIDSIEDEDTMISFLKYLINKGADYEKVEEYMTDDEPYMTDNMDDVDTRSQYIWFEFTAIEYLEYKKGNQAVEKLRKVLNISNDNTLNANNENTFTM